MVEEDYTEELAVGHVRRLLDIVACTTSFGPGKTTGRGSPKESGPKETGSNEHEVGPDNEGLVANGQKRSDGGPPRGAPNGPKSPRSDGAAVGGGGDTAEKGDAAAVLCPPPRLGQFYDFFSFSHLTPPIQCKSFFLFP
jgi:protein TIF31